MEQDGGEGQAAGHGQQGLRPAQVQAEAESGRGGQRQCIGQQQGLAGAVAGWSGAIDFFKIRLAHHSPGIGRTR